MPVLLHGFVVVAERAIGHEVHMISVVESVVGEIVTSCSCDGRDHVKVIYLRCLYEVSTLHHDVHHLRNIQAVKVIVICHILAITLIDIPQEAHHLYIVEVVSMLAWMELMQVEQHLVGDSHEGMFAAQRPIDLEAVEIDRAD